MPILADYLGTHPEVEIELQLNDRVVDLVDEGFDAAFRFGDLPDSGLVARPLRRLGRVVCASPAYLTRRGTPASPDALTEHECLAFHYIAPERDWLFHRAGETRKVTTSGRLTVNNGPALLQAALAGMGIVLLPDYLAAAEIEAGRLMRLFPEFDMSRAPAHIVYLPDRQMTPKMRSFLDFLIARLGRA
jgi:DNA-binding transcriptional LysR family regulator